MKANGWEMSDTVKGMKGTRITINTREIFKMVRLMAKVSILGPMGKCSMENGKMESKRAMVFGKEFLKTRS